MSNTFRPLLAHTVKDINTVDYPVIISPKIDGIRCLVFSDGRVLSRSLKPIRNEYIRGKLEELASKLPPNTFLDGELVAGDNFQDCSSGIMSIKGEPLFGYIVFDYVEEDNMGKPYAERFVQLGPLVHSLPEEVQSLLDKVVLFGSTVVHTPEELQEKTQQFLEAGYEGSIIRSKSGKYKTGRSTLKEGICGKIKPFADAEFKVVGYKQKEKNNNVKETNELGLSKRSSSKEGKELVEELGALTVAFGDSTFDVGSGFTQEQRETLWEQRDTLIGMLVKVKYMDYGIKTKPRHPVFLGLRSEDDL